jgi:putative flippase GtrA
VTRRPTAPLGLGKSGSWLRATNLGGVRSPSSSDDLALTSDSGWLPKVLRYTGGSVVATACSEVTFVLLYGPLHVATTPASVCGWLAGALPNYWLNRAWAWRRTGRPSFLAEVLPYVTIVLLTLLLATAVTRVVDAGLEHRGLSSPERVTLVAAAFFGVYVVMFFLRFLLLDRLFARLSRAEDAAHTATKGLR